MKLDSLKQQYKNEGRKTTSSILKVDRYENPQEALNLVAHICTAASDIDLSACTNDFYTMLENMQEIFEEKEFIFANKNFFEDCKDVIEDIEDSDARMTMTIGVAGGYSSGKSTFLNALTNIGDMLPTGIDPVSIVNTDINCNPDATQITVRGRNVKDDIVLLDKDVLGCIKHSSKTKVFLTSVLKKLTVDIPAPDYLRNICFIDTPGYNNSGSANKENGVTDKETALIGIERADAVIWCIDSEIATVTDTDFNILKSLSVPFILVFTKKDKKSEGEIKRIMRDAERICGGKLSSNPPYDIAAVSCTSGDIESVSLSGRKLFDILKQLKNECGANDLLQSCCDRIENLFTVELLVSEKKIRANEQLRQKLIERKKRANRHELNELEDETDEILAVIRHEKEFCKLINETKPLILQQVKVSCIESIKVVKKVLGSLQHLKHTEDRDIFSAIGADNMPRFLACCGTGVDMSSLSRDKYTPLTAAVACGNNEMVKFIIDHTKGMSILRDKDGRGYNSFETAVINHYKDICSLLLAADPQLPRISRSVVELSRMNNFEQWIKQFS